jgi:transcriptional regulator GlxA family with amidase domain
LLLTANQQNALKLVVFVCRYKPYCNRIESTYFKSGYLKVRANIHFCQKATAMATIKKPTLPGPIGFLLIPQFTSISFASAVESLRIANRYVDQKYQWHVLSLDGKPVPDSNGIRLMVHGSVHDFDQIGTLLIIADLNPRQYAQPDLVNRLRQLSRRGVALGGIDNAAQIIAAAGLLKGYRATMHWENAPAFHELYPDVEITSSLFEFDRDRITCAGGTAAIDMMLDVIEADHGREVAVRVSEHFIHKQIRKGTERQRTDIPQRFAVHHPKIVQAIRMMEQEIEEPLRASELAELVGLSTRQLLRLFKEHLNSSPGKLYMHLRLEHARLLIAQSDMSVIDVAIACGFQSHSHFSRVYRNKFGHSPRGGRVLESDHRLLIMDSPGKPKAS